jgi:hypothetical protein
LDEKATPSKSWATLGSPVRSLQLAHWSVCIGETLLAVQKSVPLDRREAPESSLIDEATRTIGVLEKSVSESKL